MGLAHRRAIAGAITGAMAGVPAWARYCLPCPPSGLCKKADPHVHARSHSTASIDMYNPHRPFVMPDAELYEAALRRATQPDTDTDRKDEKHDVPALTEADRAGCERWLNKVNFLQPGKDEDIWKNIKRNWIGFLSATSEMPDATLAPNRKVVRFDELDGESERGRTRRFREDRQQRMVIQSSFWNELDGLEAMTQRWPPTARVALSAMDTEPSQDPFQTLAPIWKLGQRRRYQAVWTSLVAFLVHSQAEGTLEEMGLKLDEDQTHDVLDVLESAGQVNLRDIGRVKGGRVKGVFHDVWVSIHGLLTSAMVKEKSTGRNNPMVWWLTILVRSAHRGARPG
ncbi:hypothetical protein HIM_12176 [Hirsutella minnesotensis 3608]|uniref:Uncharacterized protein n=1 Tax=Hirsutella minnesotensis 3608 TaxID=1043627 RepID=A0A0F7ZW65_9HYPO|nr:hypothetical protein HIM_12176 [Hirsutella minnesotensis 3608]